MSKEKYPADIIETVARAIRDVHNAAQGDRYMDGWRREAVAVLDALGLTVTEVFGIDYGDEVDDGWGDADGARRTAERNLRQATPGQRHLYEHTIVRRTILYAETPWVEVES